MSTVQVKIGSLPGKLTDLVFNDGQTLADALREHKVFEEVQSGKLVVRIRGSVQGMDYRLQNGDLILLTKEVKGNCR